MCDSTTNMPHSVYFWFNWALEAECRRARNGKGESGIRRSGGDSAVLRDELTRQMAESVGKDRVVEKTATIAELRMEIERLRTEIGQARGHDGAPRTDQSGAEPVAHSASDAGTPAARRRRTRYLP